MNSIILQPAGNAESRAHYSDTILNPVVQSRLQPFISKSLFTKIKEIYNNNPVPIWE